MSTIRTRAYNANPHCQEFEQAHTEILLEWQKRVQSPAGDAAMRADHAQRMADLEATRDAKLLADGLQVQEGWEQGTDRNAWIMDVVPVGTA